MKTLSHTLFFAVSMLLPVFAFSQNTMQISKHENTDKPKVGKVVQSQNKGLNENPELKTDNQNQQWSENNRYNVSKRNKKIGKMKVEQCEIKQGEAGTSKSDTKAICGPKK